MHRAKWVSNRLVRWTGVLSIVVVAAGLVAIVPAVRAAGDAGKPGIEDIMKSDFKGNNSLVKKIATGKGTADDISKLLADEKTLADMDPPKGSKDDWQTRLKKLVAATEAVQTDKTATKQFTAAANCKACHELHKEKK